MRDAFTRIGKLSVPVNDVIFGESEHYRNKAQYPVAQNGKTGFYAKRSHTIVPCDDCLLQPEDFSKVQKLIELFVKVTLGVKDDHDILFGHVLVDLLEDLVQGIGLARADAA